MYVSLRLHLIVNPFLGLNVQSCGPVALTGPVVTHENVGEDVGEAVFGDAVGARDGDKDGDISGDKVGDVDGVLVLGDIDWVDVGDEVGDSVGARLGESVGATVGAGIGAVVAPDTSVSHERK